MFLHRTPDSLIDHCLVAGLPRLILSPLSNSTPVLALVLLAWFAGPVQAEWVESIAEAELGIAYDNNLNRSAFTEDEEEDHEFTGTVSVGRYYQVKDNTRFSITGDLGVRVLDQFTELNSASIGTTVTLHHKYGVGTDVPWVQGFASLSYLDVKDHARDSTIFDIGLRAGKRFMPRLDGQVEYFYRTRDGENGPVVDPSIDTDVFDQDFHKVSANLNFLATNRLLLSTGYSYRDGEFDSACTPGNVGTVFALEDVKAIAFDDVFGGCVYRLDGTLWTFSLGASYALGRETALLFTYQNNDGKADELHYSGKIYRISVGHHF